MAESFKQGIWIRADVLASMRVLEKADFSKCDIFRKPASRTAALSIAIIMNY